jgi:Ni/Fe-hydrogenase subunit HybB-like protein
MTEKEPLGKKVITWPFLACLFVALIALYFIAKRFIFGIGAVSNMNDGYPWGIWIAFDVVVGTALACGGYAMALLVYVFNKGEYSPLVRPALMTSVFGYTLAGVSVLIDIGRYWQAYNIILPWYSNLHSVMFEVALCIGTYCLVLWMELTPAFLEKYEARRLQEKLNRIIFVFIALGILLPTMHQSSLGTMMLMAGYKLSPLWRTQFLPLLFLLTALLTGYAVVIMESYLSAVWFKRPFETNLLSKMANFIPWLLGIYLVIRIQAINTGGNLVLAFDGSVKGNMFLVENLFLFVAFLLLLYPANRRSARGLFLSALFIVTGASFYRINTYITGFDPGTGWTYFPSVPEIMITLGLVAIEGMAYFWMVNRLPILPKAEHA